MSQREYNFAIVDEVDSILIDEARTPLIISGPTEDNSDLYIQINKFIPKLAEDDIEVDEKSRTALLTEKGTHTVEDMLRQAGLLAEGANLYDLQNLLLSSPREPGLRAHKKFHQ